MKEVGNENQRPECVEGKGEETHPRSREFGGHPANARRDGNRFDHHQEFRPESGAEKGESGFRDHQSLERNDCRRLIFLSARVNNPPFIRCQGFPLTTAEIYFAQRLNCFLGTASSQLSLSGKLPVLHQKSKNNAMTGAFFPKDILARHP
jgi:hypothetical protein